MKHLYLAYPSDLDPFKRLKGHLSRGDTIAFVGAGMRARAGFADWDTLLDQLQGRPKGNKTARATQKIETEDLPWVADAARKNLTDSRYHGILRRFSERSRKMTPPSMRSRGSLSATCSRRTTISRSSWPFEVAYRGASH